MLKKIIVVVLLAGLIGALFIGAVNRTLARADSDGTSQGRGRQAAAGAPNESSLVRNEQNQDYQGNGYRGGRGSQDRDLADDSFTNGIDTYAGANQYGGFGWSKGNESAAHEPITTEGELSESDQDALIFMREEEKLARDVYLAMYEYWDLPIFLNISRSEQSHTEAIKSLLDAYNVPDPASDDLGVFTNPDLQSLYDQLIAQGSQSLGEALRVGATIEEIDILDLQERLAQTENAAIQRVFSNLLQGSSNHLRAFTSTLKTQTGETYQPQFMSMDAYQAIVDGAITGGGQGRGARGGRGGRP